MNNQICFLSVAIDDPRYIVQQNRLLKSIKKFHPEAVCMFWTNSLPEGAKSMNESMYGFKVHAVKEALKQGYNKIIWLDTACYLVKKVTKYFDLVKDYGVVAVQDDNLLCNYCNWETYNYFGTTKVRSSDAQEHLVGGSVYVFDFELPLCRQVFEVWENAEYHGMFGTSSTLAHRHDESCMALSLYACGSKPVPYAEAYYNEVPKPIVKKMHFK